MIISISIESTEFRIVFAKKRYLSFLRGLGYGLLRDTFRRLTDTGIYTDAFTELVAG